MRSPRISGLLQRIFKASWKIVQAVLIFIAHPAGDDTGSYVRSFAGVVKGRNRSWLSAQRRNRCATAVLPAEARPQIQFRLNIIRRAAPEASLPRRMRHPDLPGQPSVCSRFISSRQDGPRVVELFWYVRLKMSWLSERSRCHSLLAGSRGIFGNNLLNHQPVEQAAQRRQMLLHERRTLVSLVGKFRFGQLQARLKHDVACLKIS
jgi:hypothetical protein